MQVKSGCTVKTQTSSAVEFILNGKHFSLMSYVGNTYFVYSGKMGFLSYDDVESYRDALMQLSPESQVFLKKQMGFTLAECQVLLDNWVDAVALYQTIH